MLNRTTAAEHATEGGHVSPHQRRRRLMNQLAHAEDARDAANARIETLIEQILLLGADAPSERTVRS